MKGLSTDKLPPLPQCAALTRLVPRLWEKEDVVALWVGGSLASGTADEYSDVDLRIAVKPDALEAWKTPDFDRLFADEYVGGNRLPFGDDAFLHHLLLSSGDIFDFWVQSWERDPAPEYILILGCRDLDYLRRLQSVVPQPAVVFPEADPTAVRQAIVDFWINSLKAVKVLSRDLDLLTVTGLGIERAVLVRLWHVQATGHDTGAMRVTIHSLTQTVRGIEGRLDERMWQLQGAPLTTRAERIRAIEDIRDEVAVIGRTLAEAMGFEYPEALETTVRRTWQKYLSADSSRGPQDGRNRAG